MGHILVTGSSGLIGSALVNTLRGRGIDVASLDVAAGGAHRGDVRDREQVRRVVTGADGIVHLAAVSRVIWGERDPVRCWKTNVGGVRNVLDAAARSPFRPWVIFASSREVYGQPDRLPATEACPRRPVNLYGRSKLAGERLIDAARSDGLRACTIRLSNVYGATSDHRDRVVPAFARAAALGGELCVEGPDHTFDFTHVEDVVRGIVLLIEFLTTGASAPTPIHFVTGVATTLGELATKAVRIAGTGASVRSTRPRDFDVARFVGAPDRAKTILGWSPLVSVETGLGRLIQGFRDEAAATHQEDRTP